MRHSFVGAVLIAGLVIAATAARSSSQTAPDPAVDFSRAQHAELITHVSAADGLPQLTTVIDPRKRVMAVYLVDRATGQITLKSVRNITWDLQMTDYNTGNPLPQDVRSGLPR